MKVLQVVTDFGCGGTEGQVVALSNALDARRCELHFACMRRAGHLLPAVEAKGIPLREYRFPTFFSLQCVRQQWRLGRYIARQRIDVVHTYNFYANVFAVPAARCASAPVIVASIRDRGVYLTPKQTAVQRYVCRMADCILVNAEAIKSWLIDQGYASDRIVVIRNGVDLSRFPLEDIRGALRQEFQVPLGAPIVGVVGRVRSLKGIEDAIDAAGLASANHPNLRLLIIGEALRIHNGKTVEDTEYVETLKIRAHRAGLGNRAIFTGYRADVPQLLSQLTVSVQPSLNEGLSNVVLESMAAGVPVVATRVGGTPEALVPDVTGLLVPPADPRALAAAIERVMDHPAKAAEIGVAARRRIEEQFAIAHMQQATERLYEDLLARRSLTRSRRPTGHRPGPDRNCP